MGRSVGVYRSSELAAQLAREAVKTKTMSVVVIGSIYTEGVTPETPAISLYDEFDAASIRAATAASPLVFVVDTEEVEPEMILAMLPVCAPALLRLPRAIPKLFAAIKAEPVEAEPVEAEPVEAEPVEAEPTADRKRLVIFDPLQGPSTTTHLMLMACDTVVVPFDGTRASLSALRLFLSLAPSWLEHYKPILRSHRPRIVVFATGQTGLKGQEGQEGQEGQTGLAEEIASRLFPSAVVVSGTIAQLIAHLTA
jgi:hypothetical protein